VRVLGIDVGRRRTGLALSDPAGVTCTPLAILVEPDEERVIRKIVSVAEEREVGAIVVGLPRPLSGRTNRQAEDVLAFVARLERQTTVPVLTWDERFTSKLAEQGRTPATKRDAVAACYMLQNYLDSCGDTTGDI
jgi:putative Holliday junction resolvase